MDQMRWRHGGTNPVVAAVDSSTAIGLGDLVYQDTDDAKPASAILEPEMEYGNVTFVDLMRHRFVCDFLGVAMQRSRSGDSNPICVATTGVFEFECPSGTFELGDLVGAAENADGSGLLDQQVTAVTVSSYAVGRVTKRVSVADSSVLVDIRSQVMGRSI